MVMASGSERKHTRQMQPTTMNGRRRPQGVWQRSTMVPTSGRLRWMMPVAVHGSYGIILLTLPCPGPSCVCPNHI